MKKALMAVAALAAIVSTGCGGVVFTSPLVGPGESLRDDRLVGNWASASDPKTIGLVIRLAGDRYSLWDSLEKFQKHEAPKELSVTRIGGQIFFQLSDDCSNYTFFGSDSKQRCFAAHIAEIGDGKFRYWSLDQDRLAKDSFAGLMNVEHEIRVNVTKSDKDYTRETTVVLKGETEDLRSFVSRYARDASIWSSQPAEYVKVSN